MAVKSSTNGEKTKWNLITIKVQQNRDQGQHRSSIKKYLHTFNDKHCIYQVRTMKIAMVSLVAEK